MKIVLIETYVLHYEILGYFFYLKKRKPEIDIVIYAQNPKETWLDFFRTNIINIDVFELEILHKQPINADIAFINTIDIYDKNITEKVRILDDHIDKLKNFHIIKQINLQLHCGTNKLADRYKNQGMNLVSPFPISDYHYQILPYDVNHLQRNVSLSAPLSPFPTTILNMKKLKLSIVGVADRTNTSAIQRLSPYFEITHFCRKMGNARNIRGVRYVQNLPTDKLVESLLLNTDYILIDYEFSDRLTGIIVHAISLEKPFIIRKEYADKLNIPSNIYVSYEKSDDIIRNVKLKNDKYYSKLIDNIRSYKQELILKADNYFNV